MKHDSYVDKPLGPNERRFSSPDCRPPNNHRGKYTERIRVASLQSFIRPFQTFEQIRDQANALGLAGFFTSARLPKPRVLKLVTRDETRYRVYFPDLKILAPGHWLGFGSHQTHESHPRSQEELRLLGL
jgi:hypothetical protein